ncbi:hypothetical protein Pyn_31639 [Prunus yedoensis var. nudiflora]|uniref:Uncharacterized protein n=1 Tax=Prunus yedoensis var. nudiflora TaxID=2094558 RepID=A0A314V133_PRUYE|nr:hypothetical protein Pyn_31639 [Prunus yedoensis var. nudiflora]
MGVRVFNTSSYLNIYFSTQWVTAQDLISLWCLVLEILRLICNQLWKFLILGWSDALSYHNPIQLGGHVPPPHVGLRPMAMNPIQVPSVHMPPPPLDFRPRAILFTSYLSRCSNPFPTHYPVTPSHCVPGTRWLIQPMKIWSYTWKSLSG